MDASLDSPVVRGEALRPCPARYLSAAELEIVKRPDGTDWALGSGGFGTVRCAALCATPFTPHFPASCLLHARCS